MAGQSALQYALPKSALVFCVQVLFQRVSFIYSLLHTSHTNNFLTCDLFSVHFYTHSTKHKADTANKGPMTPKQEDVYESYYIQYNPISPPEWRLMGANLQDTSLLFIGQSLNTV
jgi:hypothetical protein